MCSGNRSSVQGDSFRCYEYLGYNLCKVVKDVLEGVKSERYVVVDVRRVRVEVIIYDKEIGNIFIEARLPEKYEMNVLLIKALATAAKVFLNESKEPVFIPKELMEKLSKVKPHKETVEEFINHIIEYKVNEYIEER